MEEIRRKANRGIFVTQRGNRNIVLGKLITSLRAHFAVLAEEEYKDRSGTDFLPKKLDELITSLTQVNTTLLHEMAAADIATVTKLIWHGIGNETLVSEQLMYPLDSDQNSTAFEDIRHALGVDDLTTLHEKYHAGVMASLRTSVFLIDAYLDRVHEEWVLPDAGFVTADLAHLILEHADREATILEYLKDRRVLSDEVDTEHLRGYLNAASPSLADGHL
jgi:hypothetical protein